MVMNEGSFTVAVLSSPNVNLSKHRFFHSVGPYPQGFFYDLCEKNWRKNIKTKKNGSQTFAKSNARASFET